ncbi:MAG TPA: basic amino acid/polyamine antiporter [Nocardioides sp.]|nr:basic amino acid/polyamine antiporter [Nocardioides sp.]
MSTKTPTAQKPAVGGTVSVLTLTGLVVGSMVGGGIFTLPSDFGAKTGVLGAVIAWVVTGVGMLTLAFVFQRLAVQRPDLDNGIYSYAQAGFGHYAGFSAAWGYWASNIVGNVFFLTFAMAALGEFVPGLGEGTTVLAVACGSAVIWVCHLLISHGVRQATIINRIVTVAKLVPIVVFIVVVLVSFDPGIFRENLWGSGEHTADSLFDQVRSTMLVTTFVFLGIEGASVYSRLARRREDVGRATVLGFVSTLALFASVTIVSYGVETQKGLAHAREPAMGSVLGSVTGDWGSTLVDVGVIVSVLGAFLAWTLLNTESMYIPAADGVMPQALASTTEDGTPRAALLVTNLSVQAFLLLVLVVEDALDFMLSLDAALTLVPYLLSAAYAVRLADRGDRRALVVPLVAVVYSLFLIYAAGPRYLLLGCLVYAPGFLLYLRARREEGQRLRRAETWVAGGLWGLAGLAVVLLATDVIAV